MRRISRFVLVLGMLLAFSGCAVLDGVGVGWSTPSHETDETPEQPGQTAPAARSTREVVLFYTEAEPYLGHPSSHGVVEAFGEHISAVVGFWYQIDRNHNDRLVPFGATTPENVQAAVELARDSGARPVGLFHNLLYGRTQVSRDVAANLFQDQAAQRRLIESIGQTALSNRLVEVNVDLENVEPEWRESLSSFVEKLSAHLHRYGVQVSISVPAKTFDQPTNRWSGAFDYRRLGQAADRVYLMTYDEHGFSSGPGPIASSGWVERVVKYAVSEIPSHKVYVGLAGYGFDWPTSGRPRYISHAQAVAKAKKLGIPIRWDSSSNSPTYSYRENGMLRHVWFENASSTSWKLDLVEAYDLGGVALWRGGLEDPDVWRVISEKFVAHKEHPAL